MLELLPSLFQGAMGLSQLIGGNKRLATNPRPEYNRPKEVDQALTLAAQQYADPNSIGYINAQRSAGLAQSNAVNASVQGGGGLGMVSAITAGTQNSYNNIAAQQEAQKAQERQALSGQLQNVADYKDEEFQINKFAPYQQKYNEGREMVGAGATNVYQGLSGLSALSQLFMKKTPITPISAGQTAAQMSAAAQGITNGISQNSNMSSFMSSLMGATQAANSNAAGMVTPGITNNMSSFFSGLFSQIGK